MPKVYFEYNLDKDKWNILRVVNNPPVFDPDDKERPLGKLPKELVTKLRSRDIPAEQDKITGDFLKLQFENLRLTIDQKVKLFTEEWDKINDEYFKRLERILNIKTDSDVVYKAYLTSAGSCPFNARERYFMVRTGDDKIDTVTAHEIMHIEFIRNFGFYCRDEIKLSVEDFGKFQEASTFLLNDEMGDILSRQDYGYKEHQELRLVLSAEWAKNRNFKNLLRFFRDLKNKASNV